MLKPPVPTGANLPPAAAEDSPTRHAVIPLGIGLLAIIIFAVYALWSDMKPRGVKVITTGQLSGADMISSELPDPMNLITLTEASRGDQLLLPYYGDRALVNEPAGLPTFASDDDRAKAQRVGAFARQDGQVLEEIAFWRGTAGLNPAAITSFYTLAARQQGYQPLQTAASQPNNLTFIRANPTNGALATDADDVLIVRVTPEADGQLRWLLWRRAYDTSR